MDGKNLTNFQFIKINKQKKCQNWEPQATRGKKLALTFFCFVLLLSCHLAAPEPTLGHYRGNSQFRPEGHRNSLPNPD